MLDAMRSSWFPVYRVLGALAAPIAARRLARAAAGDPALVARRAERHGRVPDAAGELWVHAASVGELAAAEPLIARLQRERGERIVLSTMTHTAAARARDRVTGASVRHVFAPLDRRRWVSRWLDHTRPARLLLIETEIWPVLLAACRERAVPVALVNARLSARAFARCMRFRSLFGQALSAIDPVVCQSSMHAERFAALGVTPDRLAVCGNLKFDVAPPAGRLSEPVAGWKRSWGDRPVWVAGSTHAGEEALIARAHAAVRERVPGALAIVAPRHPERAADVLSTLASAGLAACSIDSLAQHPEAACAVVDRIGVLPDVYRACGAAFVGGSLVDGIGGHNLVEPALGGRPVIAGPYRDEQHEAASVLDRAGALMTAADADALAGHVADLLTDEDLAARHGAAARAAFGVERGALDCTMERLAPWLDGAGG
jgi:3-deoxy-D-manno-octulosonic-acid transferase